MTRKKSKPDVAATIAARDPAILETLEKDFQALDRVSPGLASRAADFVLTGGNQDALDEVAQAQRATGGFGSYQGLLYNGSFGIGDDHKLFLRDHGPHGLPTLMRFGMVLAAAQPAWRLGSSWQAAPRDDIRWLAHLLVEQFTMRRANPAIRVSDKNPHLRQADTLVQLAAEGGLNVSALIELLFSDNERYGNHGLSGIRRALQGLEAVYLANADAVIAAFHKLTPQARIALVQDLSRLRIALSPPFAAVVWRQACSTSKTMAAAARSVLAGLPPEEAIALAQASFAEGDAAARRGAAQALAHIAGAAARDTLMAQATAEKTKAAGEAIKVLVALLDSLGKARADMSDARAPADGITVPEGATVLRTIDGRTIVIPPMPPLLPDTPLPADALEPLRTAIPAYNEAVRLQNAQRSAHAQAQGWAAGGYQEPEIDGERFIPELLSVLNEAGAAPHHVVRLRHQAWSSQQMRSAFEQIENHPGITLWHLARLLSNMSGGGSLLSDVLRPFHALQMSFSRRGKACPDIRVVVAIGATLGHHADGFVRSLLQPHRFMLSAVDFDELPSLRHHIFEQIHVVEEALGMRAKNAKDDLEPERALELLAMLGSVPDQFLPPLIALAVGSRYALRQPARALLKSVPNLDDAILVRLADPKKEARIAAADWLGTRGRKSVVPALVKALKKETSEEARAVMLTALSRLGADLSEQLSEKALKAEAARGLEKTPAKALDWFPHDQLPALRWESGKRVDPLIVKWWVVLADRLKNPAGNALFEFYLDRLRPEDAAALGLFVLSAFIARDTISPSEAEAQAAAKVYADQQQQYWQRWNAQQPQSAAQHPFDYAGALEIGRLYKLGQHLHSAAEHRGVLGLAARAPGGEAAAIVRRYLKEHGSKTSQARSLLAALSANPAPAAIQLVLAAANRLKQKSTQAYATELVGAIAERRGWTRDELADRTIPSGGFDEAGQLELPCGDGRLFKAIYHGEGRIELLNPAGRSAKALPEARGDDNAEAKAQVAASKKALSAARKEVKQVEKMQAGRLYEAMCVERVWPAQVWRDNLADHPIVGRLCRRLVWLGLDADVTAKATFRPLDDGTLSGNDDDALSIDDLAAVKLAHQALLSEKDCEAWSAHLRDYEVRPLFQQFGRPPAKLDAALADGTEITDRKGWMIDNFKLANAAGKLGYERGPAGDGGRVDSYSKRFSGIDLSAVITFSGHYIAESKQVPCALIALSFLPDGGNRGTGRALTLAKVAPVLLGEVWSDLHTIAAAGSGFDVDWQKKVGY